MAAFVIPMVALIVASHSLFLRGPLHSGIYFFVFLGLVIPSLLLVEAAKGAITRSYHALPAGLAIQPELRVWFNDRFFLPAGILNGEANAILLAGPSIDADSLRTAQESQTGQPRPSLPSALWSTFLPTAPIFWTAFHKTYNRQHDIVALAAAGLIAVAYCGHLFAGRRKTA